MKINFKALSGKSAEETMDIWPTDLLSSKSGLCPLHLSWGIHFMKKYVTQANTVIILWLKPKKSKMALFGYKLNIQYFICK